VTSTQTRDGVELHVLHNALANIAAEMALVMMKTSYSTIFNEGLDFTTVLLDRDGNLIAEKNYTPSMMGAIPHTVRWTLEEFGAEFFQPGDVVVHNDPYRGNCHLPEHMMMKPIFARGELVGFAGNIGHVAEIGGKAPGSFASDATDVYQEGLRLPPVKLLEGGRYKKDVWRLILANHRTPRHTWGDFHAMIGSLNVGEARLLEVIADRGAEAVVQGAQALIEYSERRMRAEILELPDGSYPAEMLVEDDGVSPDPFRVVVKMVVRGDEVIADFTGSDRRCEGR
jgi:N-methylhydantoinase B